MFHTARHDQDLRRNVRRDFRHRLAIVAALTIWVWIAGSLANPASVAAQAPLNDKSAPADRVELLPTQLAGICDGVVATSVTECEALVLLFASTDGPHWTARTNWLDISDSRFPCHWHGVSCAGGHVTALDLTTNNLRGPLPWSIGALDGLVSLQLADNHLTGDPPLSLCTLVDNVLSADLSYNQLRSTRDRLRVCLNQLDADWADTQTVPPLALLPDGFAAGGINLGWQPISYSGDGGYYEVSFATARDGPYSVHGLTANKSANNYLLDGLQPGQIYYIRVRTHTPSGAAHPTEQWSAYTHIVAVSLSDADPVLVIVYFPADNDLSPYIESVMRRVAKGTALNPNIQAVMLVDGRGEGNTRVVTIAKGVIDQTSAVQNAWGTDELDTTDPKVLAWFLSHARAEFAASRTVVSLMGHGVGLVPEFAWLVSDEPGGEPEPQSGLPALPKGIEHTPGDVADGGGYMSTPDFSQALAAATNNGADPFDVLFFDQCFQGNLEVLYEVREAADVFVASPNYAWLIAAYHHYLTQFTPTSTPQEMAQAIIQLYQAALNDHHPNVILRIDRADIGVIAAAVSQLGAALSNATLGGADATILDAALNSQFVDTTQCGAANLELGPPDELLGLESFAQNLQAGFGAGDPHGVHAAASAVLAALANVQSTSRTGQPYIAPDTTWDYDNTLTLLAPLQRDLTTETIWRASVYGESAPLTAVWAPQPSQTVQISSTFAFARDSQWDEFIDTWYTASLPPTVGEWCHYIPPVLVAEGVTDTLELTLDATQSEVQLSWSAADNDAAAEYWLLAKDAADLSWSLLAVVDLAQTSHSAPQPGPGETRHFMVLVQDELGVSLAQSNEEAWTAAHELYLPVIHR